MPIIYTPNEIAKILRISYRKVLDLIAVGDLPAFKVHKVYRISEANLMQYLESTRTA